MTRPSAAILSVGAATAAASLAVAPGPTGVLGGALALLMLAIAVVDGRNYVIPDELTIGALLLGLVHAVVAGPSANMGEALGLAIVRGLFLAAAFFGLRVGYYRLRQRQGLGLGDVKLSAVAGVWLDWEFLPLAIEIAALAAIAFYLVRQLVLRRRVRVTARLPFGLFLAPSIWVGWLIETTLSHA